MCVPSRAVAPLVNSQDRHMFSNLENMWSFFSRITSFFKKATIVLYL